MRVRLSRGELHQMPWMVDEPRPREDAPASVDVDDPDRQIEILDGPCRGQSFRARPAGFRRVVLVTARGGR